VHGYHAPLEIALPIIVAFIIVKVVVSKVSGRPAIVGKIKVRCSVKDGDLAGEDHHLPARG
jgi:hypothetical protein